MRLYFPEFTLSLIVLLLWNTANAGSKSNVEITGDYLQYALPLTALGAAYLNDDIEGQIEFGKSFFTTIAITHSLKNLVPEKRPNGNDTKSFVSGHTSASFASAAFIQKRYGWNYGLPAYLAATYVGWSRIESKQHYTSDVLRGAAIGILSTYQFTNEKKNIRVRPRTDGDTTGVEIIIDF